VIKSDNCGEKKSVKRVSVRKGEGRVEKESKGRI